MHDRPQRFILTGAPGAGKTTIAEGLRARGHRVIDEAATAIIAFRQAQGRDEPWTDPDFLDLVVALQRRRQLGATEPGVHVFDRSPLCTVALARYLGRPVTPTLAAEVDRVLVEEVYDRRALLVHPIGSVTPTAARRIGSAESLAFARVHEQVYRAYGFELVDVPPADVAARVSLVEKCLQAWSTGALPADREGGPENVNLT